MKFTISEKSKRVIATGSMMGRRVKAIAVCNEPVFDETIGKEVARRKYKIAEKDAQISAHKARMTDLKDLIEWCQNEIAHEEVMIQNMHEIKNKLIQNYTDYVENNVV